MNRKLIKIIVGAVLLIVVILLVWFIWNFTQAKNQTVGSILQKTQNTSKSLDKVPGIIILSTSKQTFKVGETMTVSINFSSRQFSDGADVILLYDPKLLSVELNANNKPVNVGAIYQEYPENSDDKNGRITVSGISSTPEGNVASGLFGTVNFKAKAAGKATISLDFTKGSSTDTNITEAENSQDILEAVQNVEVVIVN